MQTRRLPIIDVLRGCAVTMMIAYHFCYDTTLFRITQFQLREHWFWTGWRAIIVTSFLLLVGISLQLAQQGSARGFGKRWLQIAGSALLVTIGSRLIFPTGYIYFGILHFIAIASLLGRAALPLGRWNALLGVAALVAGLTLQSPLFDHKALSCLGFVTHLPETEDYVPLFPWLGVVLIGIAGAALWQRHGYAQRPLARDIGARAPRWLAWLGRHSLLTYLLHQPLLFGGFYAARWLGIIA
ncbi:heparan-alpha-glucosaminide N-acetyltransferase [Andreprevotia lacus]|jgi:uncharacterized membrane protein|nr:heparan-alpha-glucosaminide N-acetyltransferase [Andreprevotia lacus]